MPAGLRQKDQTKKAPTGTFQRDNLLAHLEKQAKEHPDKEDLVPFTGEKRGELELQQLPLPFALIVYKCFTSKVRLS